MTESSDHVEPYQPPRIQERTPIEAPIIGVASPGLL